MNHPRCTCGGKKIGSGLPHFLAGNFLATSLPISCFYTLRSVRVNTFLQDVEFRDVWGSSDRSLPRG
jgi:hypothetical protein